MLMGVKVHFSCGFRKIRPYPDTLEIIKPTIGTSIALSFHGRGEKVRNKYIEAL